MVDVKIFLRDKHCLPQKAYENDAGFDLFSCQEVVIPAFSQALIDTGINIQLPEQEDWIYEAQIRPRSGLAAKKQISITNTPGTIDSAYRGDIKVILKNFSPDSFKVNKYDKIAQMVINKIPKTRLNVVDTIEELSTTDRGSGGFGSTGNIRLKKG